MSHAIPSHHRRFAAAVVAASLFAIGLPAAARADCVSTATTKAFKSFGDNADYSLVSNGAFESGTAGWSLSSASVVSGNETFKVHGATDSHSLAIKATGTAVSPSFCVDTAKPTFRFFARQTSGSWATMLVQLRWKGADGATNTTTVGSLNGSSFSSWQPTAALPLSSTLPLWQSGQTLSVQLVFDPENYGGAWAIDDTYVDPYARG